MNIKEKVAKFATNRSTVRDGISQIKKAIPAFEQDVSKIPEPQNHCVHCVECRQRAEDTCKAFRAYFAMVYKVK